MAQVLVYIALFIATIATSGTAVARTADDLTDINSIYSSTVLPCDDILSESFDSNDDLALPPANATEHHAPLATLTFWTDTSGRSYRYRSPVIRGPPSPYSA